ncbi:TonB-dependent receptor domain-containing protein [Zhouia sp. PK063]|uniref:TonB-dependent receptor n=1 Tax=Zhouia sp. PK063 TaxID=3373602 RepID=UPI00379D7647
MKNLIGVFLFLISLSAMAQEKGSVAGKITDKEANNEPLPFANILIKGTTKGTTTDFDGLYEIQNLDPGTYTVVISFVGYKTLEVPNVKVVSGKVTEINTGLSADGMALDEVVVTTVARKDSEVALMLQQKNAVEMKQAIGAQELTRKGVSNAESAVTKVTGVSKQEGVKNVFVRGLGDRYNSTTLNGLPLPSDDPEYKNISLDIFDASIINSIDINKTFGSDLNGYVGGANIDIQSKELSQKQELTLGIKTGGNTQTLSKEFYTIDGMNFLGYNSTKKDPITDKNVYNFDNGFNPESQNSQINSGISLGGGKKFFLNDKNTSTLSAYLYGSYENNYDYKSGNIKQVNAQGNVGRDLNYDQYNNTLSKILLGNFKYTFGGKNSISYNGLIINTNNANLTNYEGVSVGIYDEDNTNIGTTYIRRQQVNTNTLFVNQLLSQLYFNRFDVQLSGAYNTSKAYEPDRRTNTFIHDKQDQEYRTATGVAGYNNRYFSDLDDQDIAAKAIVGYKLDSLNNSVNKVQLGVDYRQNKRDFNSNQYNHGFNRQQVVDIDNPDALFNQESIDNGTIYITNQPQRYSGERKTGAVFANYVQSLTSNLTLNLGVRGENIKQDIEWKTLISNSEQAKYKGVGDFEKNYLLPSLNLRYQLNDKNTFRLALSKTYILPQYKEVAPFLYEDVNFSSIGNPGLKPSDVYNADLKWDFYLSNDEIISVTGFYKNIKNPINRVYVPSAAYVLSYLNTGANASVAGAELEFRKNIFKTDNSSDKSSALSYGLNASYLYSIQDLDNNQEGDNTIPAAFNKDKDKLQGASPFLLNTDLTYNWSLTQNKLMSSLVLNYFSDRVYSLGAQGVQNYIEKGVPTLDFVLNNEFNKHFSISLKAKNLLNPHFKLTQDIEENAGENITAHTETISDYQKGIFFSLGLNYKF